MPARLHFSNSLDALADRLIARLGEAGNDPFETVAIATPASAVRDWLKVRIAEKTGIAANIAFPPLENMLWDRLAERDAHRENPDRLPARLLDTFSFQGLVLSRLRCDPPAALKPYLTSRHPEDAARRLCQLAGQLASLFREYEYNRVAERGYPGLAESWRRGEASFERHLLRGSTEITAHAHLAEVRALEAWQMDIYHSLFREGGLRDQWGEAVKTYRYTLPQYAEMIVGMDSTARNTADSIPDRAATVYHLFGLSNISPFHRDLIGRLADGERLGIAAADFEIYALNPCAEYWEDVLTLRERRRRGTRHLEPAQVDPERVAATRPTDAEREAGEFADAPDENGLLALFGKPGRETIKLWCQLTGHDFREDFREPRGDSLLAAVQTAVLHRTGPFVERHAPDATLRFLKAGNPRAELEAVRAEIAAALRADATLRPEDIAIIPADPAAVLPLLRAVFSGHDRNPGNIPLLMPDGGTQDEGPLLQGFRNLLTLAAGDFTREAVLVLLENPLVRRAAKLEETPLPVLAAFMEAIGFERGWGDGDHGSNPGGREAGHEGSSTAGAAIERAVVSLAVDGDDPGLDANSLPQPVGGLWGRLGREEAGAFLDWLSLLLHRLQPLRDGSSRSYAAWAGILRDIRETILETAPSEDREAIDLRRFFDEMETWGAWDPDGRETADATLVATLFADRFRGASGPGRAAFLRGGIRTGNLAALRGLPFRRVWITGLTTDFPSTGDAMPLDLRAFRRLPGESDPAARDLYSLLEVVAACTECLSLSWTQRGTDGRERQPSRALTGLMAWLESDVFPPGLPFDFEPFRAPTSPPPPRQHTAPVAFASEVSRDSFVKANDIGLFLRNPVLHATSRIFRSDDRDALDDREPELSQDLFIDTWEGRSLLDECLRAELQEPGGAADLFDHLWTGRRRGGRLPPAPWGGLEETRLRTLLSQRVAQEAASIRDIMGATGLRFEGSLRLGPQGAERPEPPVRNVSPFVIPGIFTGSGASLPCRLGGVLPWYFRGPDGWALLTDPQRDFAPYLITLCLAALRPLPQDLAEAFPGTGRLLMRNAKDVTIKECLLPGFEPETAQRLLGTLCSDFTGALGGEGHLDDVPLDLIEAVFDDHERDADAVADWAESIAALRRHAEEAGHERVDIAERKRRAIAPNPPADLEAVIRRRVLPYLRWKHDLVGTEAEDAGKEGAS